MKLPGLLRCSSSTRDGERCDYPRLPHSRHRAQIGEHGSSHWSNASTWRENYDTDQPWVIYTYGRTHDGWWPFWSSSRVLGVARIGLECTVCGTREVVTIRLPRFGDVPVPEGGKHERRRQFLADHAHPDRGAPMSWALPLRNLAAHPGGLNVDALAMRLEADINESPEATP